MDSGMPESIFREQLMDTRVLKDIIAVIRVEQQRRASIVANEGTDLAYDQWQYTGRPFVNDLCLMLLVTLRHQIEKALVRLAARAAGDGREIDQREYEKKVLELMRMPTRKSWSVVNSRLKLRSCGGYASLEALRL